MSCWPRTSNGRSCRCWPLIGLVLLLMAACSSSGSYDETDLADGVGGGIGGTGIIGVVTDLGQLVVNDRRIQVADDTLIREDGETVAIGDVQIGQVVQISASGPASRLASRTIDIRNEVIGPITKVDWSNGIVTVLNQPVTYAQGAIVDIDPKVGNMVAVSGFRLLDRTIVATRVQSVASTMPVQLYGRYELIDDAVQIDGVRIQGLVALPDLSGREIFAQGLLTGAGLAPARFEVQADVPFNGLQRDLSIAGFLDARANILSETTLAKVSEDVSRVTLTDGRSEAFGIFEGSWLPDQALFNIDRQLPAPAIFGGPDRNDDDRDEPALRDKNRSSDDDINDLSERNDDSVDDTPDERFNESVDDDVDDGAEDGTNDNESNGGSNASDDGTAESNVSDNGDNSGNIVDATIGVVDNTIEKVFGFGGFLGNKFGKARELIGLSSGQDREDRDENSPGDATSSSSADDDGGGADDGERGDSDDDANDEAGDDDSADRGGDTAGENGDTSNGDDNSDSNDDDSSNKDEADDRSSDRGFGRDRGFGDRVKDRIDNLRDGVGGILR